LKDITLEIRLEKVRNRQASGKVKQDEKLARSKNRHAAWGRVWRTPAVCNRGERSGAELAWPSELQHVDYVAEALQHGRADSPDDRKLNHQRPHHAAIVRDR